MRNRSREVGYIALNETAGDRVTVTGITTGVISLERYGARPLASL